MNQQEFWNQKFLRDGYLYGKEPNEFVKSTYVNFKKNQRVLCLGEGEGRNAVFLAKKGYEVAAIDASDIGLSKLETWANENKVEVKTKCIDINEWIPTKKYGAILFTFMHLNIDELEKIVEKIESSLKENGFFIAEVFSKNQIDKNSGGPKDLNLLYSVEDFQKCIKSLKIHKLEETIVELNEGNGHKGKASVIRLIAQKV